MTNIETSNTMKSVFIVFVLAFLVLFIFLHFLSIFIEGSFLRREAMRRWEENPDDHVAARFAFKMTGPVCGVPLFGDRFGERCELSAEECRRIRKG